MKYGLIIFLVLAVGLGVFFVARSQDKPETETSQTKDSIDKARDVVDQLEEANTQTQEAASEDAPTPSGDTGSKPNPSTPAYASPYNTPYSTPAPGSPYASPYETPYNTPYATPAPQTVNISTSANEESASPSSFLVPKGAKVNLTFNVKTEGVYYGGIDFRSLVVNSGTILAGQFKTVTFTANSSFTFNGFWPSSGVQKNVTVKINVE
jgi:hypothetical protein